MNVIAHYETLNPWAAMAQMRREMDRRVFCRQAPDADAAPWRPMADVQETDDAYRLQLDIPGVDPKDITITLEHGVLAVRGERAGESAGEDGGYRRVERVQGRFARRFSLPDDADADAITAKGENGVLAIRIAKREQDKPRQITVAA